MAAPNVVQVTSIYGNTKGAPLDTTTTTGILTCASNKLYKINSIICANVDGSNSCDVTCSFYDSSETTAFHLAKTIVVPADATLVVMGKDAPIYLEEADEIRAGASANSDLELVISYDILDDA